VHFVILEEFPCFFLQFCCLVKERFLLIKMFRTIALVSVTGLALWLGYKDNLLVEEHFHGDACRGLELGQEDPSWEPRIKKTIEVLKPIIGKIMDTRVEGNLDDPDPQGLFKRVQHPVSWGCTEGTVEIFPVSGAEGLFSEKGTYKTFIRLSKNSFDPDHAPKVSSIALKLHGVHGKRAPIEEQEDSIKSANMDTQDFIMLSYPTFPLGAIPEDFIPIFKTVLESPIATVIWTLTHRPTLLLRLVDFLRVGWSISNPLIATHYTIGPSRLGAKQAVRLSLQPCEPNQPHEILASIQNITQRYLDKQEACLSLMMQRQTEPCKDKIDDFLHRWVGSWEKIGVLKIPMGSILKNDDKCEKASFNPFHSLDDNRPLGWMMRFRRDIYASGSARRTKRNSGQAL